MNQDYKNPIGPPVIRTFEDLDYTVRATPYSHWVNYEIFEIEWLVDDPANPGKQIPHWSRKNATCNGDPVTNLDEAQLIIEGSVKWDGCSNFELGKEQQLTGCMYHGCSESDLTNLGKILGECWEMTEELCPHWDRGGNVRRPIGLIKAVAEMKKLFPYADEDKLRALTGMATTLNYRGDDLVAVMEQLVSLHDAFGIQTWPLTVMGAPVEELQEAAPWNVTVKDNLRVYAVQGQLGRQVTMSFTVHERAKPLTASETQH